MAYRWITAKICVGCIGKFHCPPDGSSCIVTYSPLRRSCTIALLCSSTRRMSGDGSLVASVRVSNRDRYHCDFSANRLWQKARRRRLMGRMFKHKCFESRVALRRAVTTITACETAPARGGKESGAAGPIISAPPLKIPSSAAACLRLACCIFRRFPLSYPNEPHRAQPVSTSVSDSHHQLHHHVSMSSRASGKAPQACMRQPPGPLGPDPGCFPRKTIPP